MPIDDASQMLACFNFVLAMVPLVIVIVVAVRLVDLRSRVQQLEARVTDLTRELLLRTRALAGRPEAAPAPAGVPVAPHPTPIVPAAAARTAPPSPPTAPPHPSAAPVAPHPAPPPAGTSGRLLERLDEIRHKDPQAPSSPAAEPVRREAPVAPASAVPAASPPPLPAQTVPPAAPKPGQVSPAFARTAPPLAPLTAGGKTGGSRIPTAPARRPRSLELNIVRTFVVVGAILLALAAIFLVKLGIDKGVFGPMLRDWSTAGAAIALVAVGQWWRKREGFWSQGLIGAGIVAMFAAVFAATTLHHFLLPVHGFILLGLTTAAAVAMSLQDWSNGTGKAESAKPKGGILIATLGLIGGFITPILINTHTDNVPGLFGYLILLHIGLVFATRIRGWTLLAAASIVLSSLWLIFWTLFKFNPANNSHDGHILGLFMLGMVGSLVISTLSQPARWRGGPMGAAATALSWIAVGLGLLAACLLVGKSRYDDFQWAYFALLTLGAFTLARMRPAYEAMAWLASMAVLMMLTTWGILVTLVSPGWGILGMENHAAEHLRFASWLTGFGVCTVLAAFACQWKSLTTARWAVLANVLAVLYVLVGYWLVPTAPRADAWGYLPLLAAVGLALLMIPQLLLRARITGGETSLTIYAHGTLALLLLAAPMGLHDSALTAAWAAILPLAALAMWRLKLPGLIAGLLVTTFLVAVRCLMLGRFADSAGEGRNLFWNPVVWSYGSTLISMSLASFFVHRSPALPDRWRSVLPGPTAIAGLMQTGAAVAAFLLLTLEVRWGFHQGHLNENSALLLERSTLAIGWLLLASAVVWMGKQIQQRVLLVCGEVIAILGLVYTVLVLAIVTNPLWWEWRGLTDPIAGMPVFNVLLYAYGVPAAVCGLLAWVLSRSDERLKTLPTLAGIAGILMLFVMVSLQVRQGFAGPDVVLGHAVASFREFATYAVAWLALGSVCLGIGRRFRIDVIWRAGIWIAGFGVAYAILIAGVIMSPMLHEESVGNWFLLNDLLYAYGTPLLLALVAAWIADARSAPLFGPMPPSGARPFENGWQLGILLRNSALALLFIFVTSQVRHGFAGSNMSFSHVPLSFHELATFVTVWMSLGVVELLAARKWRLSQVHDAGTVISLGGLAFAIFGLGIVGNPIMQGWWVGDWRILNSILYAYGVPILLAVAAGYVLDAPAEQFKGLMRMPQNAATRSIGRMLRGGAVILAFILMAMEVRQWFQGAYLNNPHMAFMERVSYAVMWFTLAAVLLPIGYAARSQAGRRGGLIIAGIALFWSLALCAVVFNPLLTHESVGPVTIFNGVLYGYGIPALFAGTLAVMLWEKRTWVISAGGGLTERICAWFGGIGGLLLVFVLVTLEVQHAFRGDHLALGPPPGGYPPGEFVAYSLAWAILGIIYLAVGIWRQSIILRWASLIMMLITIPKVFLFDMPVLHDLQRVLSFAGLGVSLMALAFVYMRFVFRREKPALEPEPVEPPTS